MNSKLIKLFTTIFVFSLIACSQSFAQNASTGEGETGNGPRFNSSMEKFYIWAEKQKEKRNKYAQKTKMNCPVLETSIVMV